MAAKFLIKKNVKEGIDFIYYMLQESPMKLKKMALKAIIEMEDEEKLNKLITYYHKINFIKLKIWILNTIEQTGDMAASNFLINELAVENRELKLNAAKALGACGQIKAVGSLKAIIKDRNMDKEIKDLAAESIEKIITRTGGVENGMLSISDTKGIKGGLSITDRKGKDSLNMQD